MVHAQELILFDQPGLKDTWRFELRHLDIIDRFGGCPPRFHPPNTASNTVRSMPRMACASLVLTTSGAKKTTATWTGKSCQVAIGGRGGH